MVRPLRVEIDLPVDWNSEGTLRTLTMVADRVMIKKLPQNSKAKSQHSFEPLKDIPKVWLKYNQK